MMDKQYGYTMPGLAPAYFNASLRDGQVVITVRSAGTDDGTTGATASIALPPSEALEIGIGVRDIATQGLPKFEHADDWGGAGLLAELRVVQAKIEALNPRPGTTAAPPEKVSALQGKAAELTHGLQELQRTGDFFWPVHIAKG